MNFKQLKENLATQYPFKVELHAHSNPASLCSQVSPEELVDIYANRGFSALVLTNHFCRQEDETAADYIERYLQDFERAKTAGEARGLRVYLGAELTFTENVNHYLLFGVDRERLSLVYDCLPHGVERFRKEHPMPDSVFLQAHPRRDHMQQVDPSLLDGVEALNMHPEHNARAGFVLRYAKEHELPIAVAGSDFHHPNVGHEGLGAVRMSELPEDEFALAKILRSGDFIVEIGEGYFVL